MHEICDHAYQKHPKKNKHLNDFIMGKMKKIKSMKDEQDTETKLEL